MEFFEDSRLELYNLRDDIGETNNLAEKKPDKVKKLHEIMLAWRDNVKAPVPTKPNPEYDPNKRYKPKRKYKPIGRPAVPPAEGHEQVELMRQKRGW